MTQLGCNLWICGTVVVIHVGQDLLSVKLELSLACNVQAAAEHWKGSGKPVPEDYERKLLSMATFCSKHDVKFVPDPYYGGPQGFDKVLDLLDDACTGLLAHIESEEQ